MSIPTEASTTYRSPMLAASACVAAVWGVLAVGLGVVRIGAEWSQYRSLQAIADSHQAGMFVVDSTPTAVLVLDSLGGLAWLAMSVVWLVLAFGRHSHLVATVVAICAGLVAVVFLRGSPESFAPGPHLVTEVFVGGWVLVGAGLLAIVTAAADLRPSRP